MISADGVVGGTALTHEAGPGSSPRSALHKSPQYGPKDLVVRPIPSAVAGQVCERKHYLQSYPGGSVLNFGVWVDQFLLGVAVLGVGPTNLHRLFMGADRREVLCLTRFWLDDRLGRNSESRALAIILRSLRSHADSVKAVVAYSDPAVGHSGAIYKATGFLYLGESEAMPSYRLESGKVYHSRTLSHAFGTHSLSYFRDRNIKVELVPRARKLIYVTLIDPAWRTRLGRAVLPYPTKEIEDGDYRDSN